MLLSSIDQTIDLKSGPVGGPEGLLLCVLYPLVQQMIQTLPYEQTINSCPL